VLRLVSDTQGLLLAILTLVRHRLDVDLRDIPEAAHRDLHLVAVGVAETIDAAADRVDGRSAAFPDCRALVAQAKRGLVSPELTPLDARCRAHLEARVGLYRDLLPLLDELIIDSGTRSLTPLAVRTT
jgi:hypothetical protein